jgi:hypothetical protein
VPSSIIVGFPGSLSQKGSPPDLLAPPGWSVRVEDRSGFETEWRASSIELRVIGAVEIGVQA